ncbi:MAG: transketolase C-terminal domain-containing protein, partial [Planctomycetota bacterium]
DAVKKESRHQTYTEVFGESLVEIADQDDRIVAITSAMCDGTGLAEFRKKYGDRFYDVGIAESTAVDIAAGLAKSGLKPVVCIYSTFLQRSFDQIISEVALQNLPVVFCIDRAGVVGSDGPTHHGLMDIGFLRMMPNMVLVAPANGVEMKLALEFAFGQDRPVAIRYPKDLVPNPETVRAACKKPFKLGKSVTVKRSKGSSIAVVNYGSLLEECLEASNRLSKESIAVDVINARFAGPIDEKILSLLGQGKSIITVEDHRYDCGFGSAVLEEAARTGTGTDNRITVLAMSREFIRHSSRQSQLVVSGVSVEGIMKTAREMHRKNG